MAKGGRRPKAGEPVHVGAIPGALIGQIRWGPNLKEIDLCAAQFQAIRGNKKSEIPQESNDNKETEKSQASKGNQDTERSQANKNNQDTERSQANKSNQETEIPGRVVLAFTKRLDVESKGGEISNYYSAYVWVMFALIDRGGNPIYPAKAHRNLLPFFEHGNIADATTLQTIKENLVAKSLSALEEIVVREEDDGIRIAYVGACDHSGCGCQVSYPLLEPARIPGIDRVSRPPAILDLLKHLFPAHPERQEARMRRAGSNREIRRTRAGSWRTFERRFRPVDGPDGATTWSREQLPPDVDPRLVWTIVDCDGRLYVSPGFHFVNRIDYVLCRVPWTDEDERQPDYRYD